jgi:HD superfamily phosphohydrolase
MSINYHETFGAKNLLLFPARIKDKLHGNIPLTKVEKEVIDSQPFQRLRRIRQTSFAHLIFPGAHHTRFEHSLGAMHVAGLMLSALLVNQSRLLDEIEDIKEKNKDTLFPPKFHFYLEGITQTKEAFNALIKEPYLTQLLRLAALLHDIGHAPFSHSCERFMLSFDELFEALPGLNLPSWLNDGLLKKIKALRSQGKGNHLMRHEIYTLFILNHLSQGERPPLSPSLAQDIAAVLDLEVEPYEEGILHKSGLRSFFYSLVSGDIDVDRMDYLLRDSQECGVVYGLFDLGRLLGSLGFYKEEKTFHLTLKKSGVPAFEDYLKARSSMYKQVYFHKTTSACEAMLEYACSFLGHLKLPLDLEAYLKINDENFYEFIKESVNFQKASSSLPSNASQAESLVLLENLLYKRKLWKRVYEETRHADDPTSQNLCGPISDFLTKQGIQNFIIKNTSTLTNIRNSPSYRNLKVLSKEIDNTPCLEDLETHSRISKAYYEDFSIERVFADCSSMKRPEMQRLISLSLLKEKL